MQPIHRMPSSIRIRRTDTKPAQNTPFSSTDNYAAHDGGADAKQQQQQQQQQHQPNNASNTNGRTPSQGATSANDYFGFPSRRRASSVSVAGGDTDANRSDYITPGTEGHWQTSDRNQPELDDDETLRLGMAAATRAIHDEERREERIRRGSKPTRNPPGDYPPIRLSDESLQRKIPPRQSSRRPGAVEGLAMRHHRFHRQQRRQKRREQRDSVSTASSHSSTSDPPERTETDRGTARQGSHGAPTLPPPTRNLSDVQEESRFGSRLTVPQTIQAAPGNASGPHSQPGQDCQRRSANRSRSNTASGDGLMASSRRLYDTLTRRRSDRDASTNDTDSEQQSALMRSHGRNNDSYDDDYTPSSSANSQDLHHEDEVVDYLDVVDPEVATVTALQNVGNSIFFPPIPFLYNRRPTISLPTPARRASLTPSGTPDYEPREEDIEMGMRPGPGHALDDQAADEDANKRSGFGSIRRVASLVPGRKNKQVPPTTEEERRKHIKEWEEMDEQERNELDEHVHLLLTKKAKFKRAARGFWRYIKTPHGFIITTYAFLITFWGTAICLFLLRWIDVGNSARQRYWIEICDQILCALFAAVGLGFAPFRAVDTYRMVQIAHYHFLTYKRRKQMHLPELKNKNELPRAMPRLNVSQMTKTMMVKSGLRNKPEAVVDDVDNADAENTATSEVDNSINMSANHAGHAVQTQDSSWELLDTVQSRQSSCEFEELKQKRNQKHKFFHRHKQTQSTSSSDPLTDPNKGQESKRDADPIPTQASPVQPRAKTAHKTYASKDGIIPLGQLKRNPSIASELPRDAEDVVVLSPKQQANLEYQQRKFHESHTFYRYRETVTHRPFELRLMMAVVILLDCHSCLQASLGGTTWGIYYKNRPTSVTATIISFSLSCNAVAGILIWLGGNRTKEKEEVERLLRIALEEEALRKIKKRQTRLEEQERQARESWEEQGRRLHGKGDGISTSGGSGGKGESFNKVEQRIEYGNGGMGARQQQQSLLSSQISALECIQEH
ncbi:uncharacterized protein MEPE_06303 [Melanopsichium pennsylvanicum]|uniref:Integral membrane protein n=2 Tax=Melanopsichium pennsylvanicum TaxID=63383 RepID=A0AAJ4XU71_9BASI|nr:conserved hypothetical protein [Melanopsichium pennsylvanicum 4]SNX87593.1 uncharacterized protein MEPE_06303 [Melanopsichium pennsylvanicum]